MSASLVGSEMCIRDRGLRGHTSRAMVRRSSTSWAAWVSGSTDHGMGGSCLLYTSDAADDM
eukprot:4577009-Alexandrium_andersonii.AAC.1